MTLGLILAILTTICNGIAAVTSRKLKNTPATILAFWNGLVVSLILGIYIAFRQGGFRFVEYAALYGFAEIGALCFIVCMFTYTIAYQSDSSGFVALISYVRIGYAYCVDRLIFHEQSFNSVQLICALVILFVTFGVAFYKLYQSK